MAIHWNNLGAGKIQVGRVTAATSKLGGLAYLRRLKEPGCNYTVDAWALSMKTVYNPKALELCNTIHAKHGGNITKENANTIWKELQAAIVEADALVPVISKL